MPQRRKGKFYIFQLVLDICKVAYSLKVTIILAVSEVPTKACFTKEFCDRVINKRKRKKNYVTRQTLDYFDFAQLDGNHSDEEMDQDGTNVRKASLSQGGESPQNLWSHRLRDDV